MKRWLGWTRANSLRLDHVGFFWMLFLVGMLKKSVTRSCQDLVPSVALTSLIFVESLFLRYWTMSLINACQQTRAFFLTRNQYKWKLLFLALVCSIYKKNSRYGTWKTFWTSKGRFDKWAKAKQDTDIPPTVQAKPFYLAWYKSCFPLLVYILLQWRPHFPSDSLCDRYCAIQMAVINLKWKHYGQWGLSAVNQGGTQWRAIYESVYVTALCFINSICFYRCGQRGYFLYVFIFSMNITVGTLWLFACYHAGLEKQSFVDFKSCYQMLFDTVWVTLNQKEILF